MLGFGEPIPEPAIVIDTAGWVWLAGSFVAALLIDFVIARLVLEWARPVAAWLFWVGRASKLAALVAWMAFFNGFWYPQYLSQGMPLPDYVRQIEGVVLAVFLGLAALSFPRYRAAREATGG
jgi:hypothetical protein